MVSVQSKQEWLLIPGLAALALIRPIMSMVGLSGHRPAYASIAVTCHFPRVACGCGQARFSRPIVSVTLTELVHGIFAV